MNRQYWSNYFLVGYSLVIPLAVVFLGRLITRLWARRNQERIHDYYEKSCANQKLAETYSLPWTIKVKWQLYLMPLLIFLPWEIFSLLYKGSRISAIKVTIGDITLFTTGSWFFHLTLIIGILWLIKFVAAYEIKLLEDRLIYRMPRTILFFRTTKEVFYSDISKLDIEFGFENSAEYGWSSFKHLHVYDRAFRGMLVIPLEYFKRRDWVIIGDSITAKVPSVEMDEFTKQTLKPSTKIKF